MILELGGERVAIRLRGWQRTPTGARAFGDGPRGTPVSLALHPGEVQALIAAGLFPLGYREDVVRIPEAQDLVIDLGGIADVGADDDADDDAGPEPATVAGALEQRALAAARRRRS